MDFIIKMIDAALYALQNYVIDFKEHASFVCKTCTIISVILFVLFTGLNCYNHALNVAAEKKVQNLADSTIDPIIEQIDTMDSSLAITFQPIKDLALELKSIITSLFLIITITLIGLYLDLIKKPLNWIKDYLSLIIESQMNKNELFFWIPFSIVSLIDMIELMLMF